MRRCCGDTRSTGPSPSWGWYGSLVDGNWMGRLPLGKVTDGPNGYGKVEAESWESSEQDRLRAVLFIGAEGPGGAPFPVLSRHKTPPECPAWSHGGGILEAGPGSCRSGLPGAAARLSASVHRCFSWVWSSMSSIGPALSSGWPATERIRPAAPAISCAYPVTADVASRTVSPGLACVPSSPCWNRAERSGVRRRSRPWVSLLAACVHPPWDLFRAPGWS